MNLLLDTHVLLWCLDDHPALGEEARAAIREGHNLIFVSAASAWEIAIKLALGKLEAPDDLEEAVVATASSHCPSPWAMLRVPVDSRAIMMIPSTVC